MRPDLTIHPASQLNHTSRVKCLGGFGLIPAARELKEAIDDEVQLDCGCAGGSFTWALGVSLGINYASLRIYSPMILCQLAGR